MSIKKAILRRLGVNVSVDRNELGEMDVLVHKEARHHAAHGYIVASNKALNIRGGVVAIVLPDFDDAPLLTPRFMLDLQEALAAKGWTFSHVVAWEGVQQFTAQGPAGEDEHASAYNTLTPGIPSTPHEVMRDDVDVPAFLRKTQGNLGAAEGVLKFQRMGRLQRPLFADNPNVARLVEAAEGRVAHLDDQAREAAKVRFEAIAHNSIATNQSLEFIADKLDGAVNVILGSHAQNEASAAIQH